MRLSIIVPAYQEENTIGSVLDQLCAIDIESLGWDKEIIVCDDGSTDGTVAAVERARAGDDRIVLISHDVNQGKGAAIRTALASATGDYTIIQDADLEYDVGDYPRLLAAVDGGADVVYGSRFLANPRPEGMRLSNFIGNRVLTTTANLLYGLGITDEATCFKVFRTELLKDLGLTCTGFEFCPEVTAKVGRRGVRIVEVPVGYTGRSHDEGKKVRWTDGVEALWVLLRHRFV